MTQLKEGKATIVEMVHQARELVFLRLEDALVESYLAKLRVGFQACLTQGL